MDPCDERLDAFVLREGFFIPSTALERGETGELDLGVARVGVDLAALLG